MDMIVSTYAPQINHAMTAEGSVMDGRLNPSAAKPMGPGLAKAF